MTKGVESFLPTQSEIEDLPFIAAVSSFRMLAARTRELINAHGAPFKFDCGYVDTAVPNAFADLHESSHVLGIHQGLVITIIEFALYVFTQADQFPQIGDAAGEDSTAPQFGSAPGIFLLAKTMRGETIDNETDRHRVPKDADRHVAAIYLAMIMRRFVWLHELAHGVNGHMLLLKDLGVRAALNEVPNPAMLVSLKKSSLPADEARRILHALELDADASALRTLCRIQLMGGENIEGIATLDFRTRMEMSLLAAYLMAWLFDEYQRFGHTLHDETHPFPRERLAHLVSFASREFDQEVDGFAPFHEEVCASFNRLAAKISGMHRIEAGMGVRKNGAMPENVGELLASLAFTPPPPEIAS
ncbi:hypothetical protein [Novosphingobium aquimarinum]|uniref:hypothetical protein n=1 Tax=Novosphingobium aquimarinum TaxID=2682494 RepID=UPI0012EC4D48|nr:hypothetical protein [Novosphingobium aquimarinum]